MPRQGATRLRTSLKELPPLRRDICLVRSARYSAAVLCFTAPDEWNPDCSIGRCADPRDRPKSNAVIRRRCRAAHAGMNSQQLLKILLGQSAVAAVLLFVLAA